MDPAITADEEAWPPFPATIEGVQPEVFKTFLTFQKMVDTFRHLVLKDLKVGGTQPSQMACLRLLATSDGLCQRDIARTMGISRPRVNSIVQALERAGAVRRERDETDHRLTRVFLTEVGRSVDAEKSLIREGHINAIFGEMSRDERLKLERHLEQITERLERRIQTDDVM